MPPTINTLSDKRVCNKMSNTYSLELVLPDIDWSVHNSPDQSESKNTEKGLTFTGALIFYDTLLVKTCCQNNAIGSHKSVISVIKIRDIAFFIYIY